MTILDILEKENLNSIPYVSVRILYKGCSSGVIQDVFAGCFRVLDRKVISLDGDTYSITNEVEKYELETADADEEGYYHKGDALMTIWRKCY